MATIKEKIEQSNQIFFDMKNSFAYKDLKKKIIEVINNNGDIIFSGIGKNWYICEKIVKTWLSMGIPCQALDCVHALHGDLGMLQTNRPKVIIFVSKSGTTAELIKLVKIINDLKTNHILKNITTVGFYLNNSIDKTLYDLSLTPQLVKYDDIFEFDERNLVPSLSINTMQMILDCIGVEIYEGNSTMVNNYKYNHLAGNNGKKLGGDKVIEEIK